MKLYLLFAFILTATASLLQALFIPNPSLICFAPLLVLLFFYSSFLTSLWVASLAGLFLDLLSSTSFGMNALCYTIAASLCYRQKKFLSEKFISFFLFTALVSSTISLIKFPLLFLFGNGMHISFKWILTDLLILPFMDALYALIFILLPLSLLKRGIKC